MIIYRDIITGDELLSDAFKPKEVLNGAAYEVDCRMITKGPVDIDIGANASAEEAEEALEDGVEKVNDYLDNFQLMSMAFKDDTDYNQNHVKGYMKRLLKTLQESGKTDEEIAAVRKGATAFYKMINKSNFKDYDFYVGEKWDTKGLVVLLNYREDGVTPYITLFKHGLLEEKV